MSNHSKTVYYEAVEWRAGWDWKVYHYDVSGNHQVIMSRGGPCNDEGEALDAAIAWCEERKIEAQLA